MRVLKHERRLPPGTASWLEQADGDQRVPIRVVHQLLEAAEKFTGQIPTLGLKAARGDLPRRTAVRCTTP